MGQECQNCSTGDSPIKAETLEIGFSGKCDVMRVKNLPLFEIASVLVRFDHVARNGQRWPQ
jgi:hypothetical protein